MIRVGFSHYRHVATPKDAATSRQNETVYAFIFRSMWGTLKGAYQLDRKMFAVGMLVHFLYIALGLILFDHYVATGLVVAAFF